MKMLPPVQNFRVNLSAQSNPFSESRPSICTTPLERLAQDTVELRFTGKKHRKPNQAGHTSQKKTIVHNGSPQDPATKLFGEINDQPIRKIQDWVKKQPVNALVSWQMALEKTHLPIPLIIEAFDELYHEGRLVPFPKREGNWRVLNPKILSSYENTIIQTFSPETPPKFYMQFLLNGQMLNGYLHEGYPIPSLAFFKAIPEIQNKISQEALDELQVDDVIRLNKDGSYTTGSPLLNHESADYPIMDEVLKAVKTGQKLERALLQSFAENTCKQVNNQSLSRWNLSTDQVDAVVSAKVRRVFWLLDHEGYIRKTGNQDYVFTDKVEKYQQTQELISEFLKKPSQFTFRIIEPSDPSQKWRLEYGFTFPSHFASEGDGILMVPQHNYIQFKHAFYPIVKDLGLKMEDSVEAALKIAQPLFPKLKQVHYPGIPPVPIELSSAELIDFLENVAPKLKEHGLGIMEPKCLAQGHMPKQLTLKAKVQSQAFGVNQGLGDYLKSTAKLSSLEAYLEDKQLTIAELDRILQNTSPLQFIKGKWVLVDHAQMQACVSLLRNGSQQTMGHLVRLSTQHPKVRIQVPQQLGIVIEKLRENASLQMLTNPVGLNGQLLDFQKRGLSWLNFMTEQGVGCILADDRGLGKTVQALALILLKRNAKTPETQRPTLVACPNAMLGTWQKAIQDFTPQFKVVELSQFRKLSKENQKSVAVVLSNYETLRTPVSSEFIKAQVWDGVILDEAQKIKNADTLTAKSVQNLNAEYRVALTGTPVENHVGEIWSIMNFLNPGLLGTEADFEKRFLKPIQKDHNMAVLKDLQGIVNPFILRRTKAELADSLQLPKKVEDILYVEPSESQQEEAEKAKLRYMLPEGLAEDKKIDNIRVLITRLKQICDHPELPLYYGKTGISLPGAEQSASPKMLALKQKLDLVLNAGEKAIVFTEFREMAGILKAYLEKTYNRPVILLTGGLKKADFDKRLADFNETHPDSPPILVSTIKTGGEGLNLQVANHVFLYDLGWNPATLRQAEDRTHRIGQQKDVHVYRLITKGTIEEKIHDLHQRKEALCQAFLPEGDERLDGMTNAELLEIFKSAQGKAA